MSIWQGNIRLEGKVIEDLPNGDRREFEIEGLYSTGDLVYDTATTVQIQLANARSGPIQLVDGPITRLAKKLCEYGYQSWADLDEDDQADWRSEAVSLLDFIKGLDS